MKKLTKRKADQVWEDAVTEAVEMGLWVGSKGYTKGLSEVFRDLGHSPEEFVDYCYAPLGLILTYPEIYLAETMYRFDPVNESIPTVVSHEKKALAHVAAMLRGFGTSTKGESK